MALKDIRETSVSIALDRPRTLKFDLNAFAVLEERYGSMEAAFQEMQRGSMKAARTLLWVGLLHEDESITEREVGSLVTLGNINDVMNTITSALTEAVPDADGESAGEVASEANPT